MSARDRVSCRDKALELLALRPHFRRQLEQKLLQRGYEGVEVDAALARLSDEGYLDDNKLAAEFAAARLERAGEGTRRVRAELERRGAAPEAIDAALSEAVSADDAELAKQAAERWSRTHRPDPAALARHLDRKGFSKRSILAILREGGGREAGEEGGDSLEP